MCSSSNFPQSVVCLWVSNNCLNSDYGFINFCLQLSEFFYMQQSQNLSSFIKNCISCVKAKNMFV